MQTETVGPRISKLAIFSLVMSLLLCVPGALAIDIALNPGEPGLGRFVGEAICGLMLLIMCVLAPIPLISGIIALKHIKWSCGFQRGRTVARIAVTLAALELSALQVNWIIQYPAAHKAAMEIVARDERNRPLREAHDAEAAAARQTQMWVSQIESYASTHGGRYPPDLETVDKVIRDRGGQPGNSFKGYYYFGYDLTYPFGTHRPYSDNAAMQWGTIVVLISKEEITPGHRVIGRLTSTVTTGFVVDAANLKYFFDKSNQARAEFDFSPVELPLELSTASSRP